MDTNIDLLAVMIGAVLYVIVFFVWYSKYLFGGTWAKLNRVAEPSLKKDQGGSCKTPPPRKIDDFDVDCKDRLAGPVRSDEIIPRREAESERMQSAAKGRFSCGGEFCNWLQGVRILGNLVLGLIISYFLAFFNAHLNVTSVADGMFVAFCIWIGFVVPTQLFPVISCKKSVKLFFIETGAMLLALLAMGGIIGA